MMSVNAANDHNFFDFDQLTWHELSWLQQTFSCKNIDSYGKQCEYLSCI